MSKDGPVLTEMNTGGVRWHVQPECQELLLGADGLRLQDWLRAGWAQIVKHGPHRTVYRIALPGLSVYLKHYRLPDFRAWLRQLVRPAKARMEYDRALAVAQRAVPTIEPLGLGIAWGGAGPGESYLITRSLEDAAPLNGFVERTLATFPEPRQTAIRQRLAVALGRLVARLHDAGIVHHDLHAANILVRLEPNDRPLLYLVDLHAVQLRAPLAWPQSQANLILLNRWFILRASRTDRLRFWHAYCRCRETFSAGSLGRQQLRLDLVDHPETRNRGRELEAQTWQSNLRFWRNRDRRCLVTNRYYYRVSTPAIWGCAVRDVTPEDLAPFLADPDGPFRAPALPLLKDSRSSTVAELDLIVAGERKQIIYKRFRATDWRDRWLPLIRRTAALRSWIFGHGLRERCLPTARPLAVLHRRRGLQTGDTYLITEKIPTPETCTPIVRLKESNRPTRAGPTGEGASIRSPSWSATCIADKFLIGISRRVTCCSRATAFS